MPYHQKDSLSQNFIKFPELAVELIASSNINKNDLVLEIGPGLGIITRELVKVSRSVIAIEKDPVLAKKLIESTKDIPNLEIQQKDFLKANLPITPYKVFANIPFSLTAQIVSKFLKSTPSPESMYFLMQYEAAKKFTGFPESQSSLLSKPWYEIKIIGDIDRSNFTKKPQIVVVFVEFKKRPTAFIREENKREYRDFITYGFNQWQPTFLDTYQKVFTYTQLKNLEKTFKLTGLRPTEVSFDTWLQIFKTYLKIANKEQKEEIDNFRPKNNS
jgi:16S rRNA A1518/A1519 N6-dimethyltransferase RsmA/KsgA/DIM1 with predicted DNA glycosylase/AP lyase activity